eukprot:1047675-Pleurochrysis_carterae.AAC.4
MASERSHPFAETPLRSSRPTASAHFRTVHAPSREPACAQLRPRADCCHGAADERKTNQRGS